jgi:KaiC/GvpD/RAD55 family RecA-like ATPase
VIAREIGKLPTAIAEFDYISYDGVPKNRSTLIAGTAGAGKT